MPQAREVIYAVDALVLWRRELDGLTRVFKTAGATALFTHEEVYAVNGTLAAGAQLFQAEVSAKREELDQRVRALEDRYPNESTC